MPIEVTLNAVQMARLLKRIQALSDPWLVRIVITVLPVFFAALLAYGFAWYLERQKTRDRAENNTRERLERQLSVLNGINTAIASNITIVIHWIQQQIIPHYEMSVAAFEFLSVLDGSPKSMRQWEDALHTNFKAVITRCPDLVLEETAFFRDLSFLLDGYPALLVKTSWIGIHTQHLRSSLADRNRLIDKATVEAPEAGLSFRAVCQYVQTQREISKSEILNAHQLLAILRQVSVHIQGIITGPYRKIHGPHLGAELPPVFTTLIKELADLIRSFGIELPPDEPPASSSG